MKIKSLLTSLIVGTALVAAAPAAMAKSETSSKHHSSHHSSVKASQAVNAKVDVNTATVKQLASLKRIGVKKATAIVNYRKENGDFKTLSDLTKVKGISQGIVDANKSRLKLN